MTYANVSIQADPVLTNVFKGYMPDDQRFIQDEIFKTVPVKTRSSKIPTLGTNFLRVFNDVVVGRTEAPVIEFDFSKTDAWECEKHTRKVLILQEDGEKFAAPGQTWMQGMDDAREMYTLLMKVSTLVSREYAIAQALQSTSVITQNVTLTGSSRFNNYANSSVLTVARTARKTIFDSTGYTPNVCIMSWDVAEVLVDHPELKGEIYSTVAMPKTSLTYEQLAKALKVEKVLVGKVKYEAAIKGATSSLTNVWGKHMTFAYINQSSNPKMFEKSLGYKFVLTDHSVDNYPNPIKDPINSEYVREIADYDDLLLDATAAYLVYTCID